MANVINRRNIGAGRAVRGISPEAELLCAMRVHGIANHPCDNLAEFDEANVDQIKDIDLAASMVEAVIDADTNSNSTIFGAVDQGDNISKRMPFLENLNISSRLRHLDIAHDEHLLRMRILGKRLETEEINYKIATRKLQIMEAENRYRIALLKAQITHLDYRNAAVTKVE